MTTTGISTTTRSSTTISGWRSPLPEPSGAVLIEGLQRPRTVALKSKRSSIVTWADVTSQAAIFEIIGESFPDHTILGEEGIGGTAGSDHTWIVDPLDGTSNYAHGLPFACVSVALRDPHGVVGQAAIFEPFRGELFTAAPRRGAWLSPRRARWRTPWRATRGVGGRLARPGARSAPASSPTTRPRSRPSVGGSSPSTRRLAAPVSLGSPALCLAYVAAGRIDAFFEQAPRTRGTSQRARC